MRVRLTAILVAILGIFQVVGGSIFASASSATAPTSSNDSLLFVGMAGVRPLDVDIANPQLSRLLANYSVAALSPRSVSPLTCPSEGWMQLRTSRDVSDRLPESFVVSLGDECHPATILEDPASLYKEYPQTVHIRNFSLRLGETEWPDEPLFSHNVTAVGRNAGIPIATKDGTVDQWLALPDAGFPEAAEKAQGDLTRILNTVDDDVVVDLGSIRGSPRYLNVADQRALIQQKLINILTANENSEHPRKVIIASLGDQWRRAHLHFFATNIALDGTTSGAGTIRSDLTRADGFITITDVRNLITGKYSGLHVQPQPSLTAAMKPVLDTAQHAYIAASSSAKWYQIFNTMVLLGVLGVLGLFLITPGPEGHRWGAPRRLWAGLEQFNLWAFAWVPSAMILNLLPWWDLPGSPGVMQAWAIAMTALIAVAIVALSHLSAHRAGFISLVSFALLCIDIVAGSVHQRNGFMGSLMLTSRRYYGISNRTYLILVVCGLIASLLVIAWLRKRAKNDAGARLPLFVLLGIGIIAVAVDALPLWGADFGGPPGLIACFGITAILLTGKKLRWWHGLLWLVSTVAVMGGVGLIDARRGGESHIGRFWAKFGTAESWAIIGGKIRDVTRSFIGRPDLLALIAIAIVIGILAVFATRYLNSVSGIHLGSLRALTSDYGFIPVTIGIAVGILVAVPINDSGAIMIKEGMYIALPGLAAMIAGQATRRNPLEQGLQNGSASVVVNMIRDSVGMVTNVIRRVTHRNS
ncbi:hypothetical protein [Arcanobacterium phocae]|uniref:hypothetical protein n=1 Tax=Arcanobacterium phocae TaxID=131112 RepID=UPI001C0F1635|nr:hypothetical protein [Arcanobacterium phocae]